MARRKKQRYTLRAEPGSTAGIILADVERARGNVSEFLRNAVVAYVGLNPAQKKAAMLRQRDALVSEVSILGAQIRGLNDAIEQMELDEKLQLNTP